MLAFRRQKGSRGYIGVYRTKLYLAVGLRV